MSDTYQAPRYLPPRPPQGDHGYEHQGSDSISFGHFLGVLRRRYRLVLLLTIIGLGVGGYLAVKSPALYKAVAVLRLAGERRALTGGKETTPPPRRTARPRFLVGGGGGGAARF